MRRRLVRYCLGVRPLEVPADLASSAVLNSGSDAPAAIRRSDGGCCFVNLLQNTSLVLPVHEDD
jgi:hypothetical protein